MVEVDMKQLNRTHSPLTGDLTYVAGSSLDQKKVQGVSGIVGDLTGIVSVKNKLHA